MTSFELIACVMLVFISAYLSASEIALFSLSRFQIKSIKDEFRVTHRKIKRLLGDPAGLLITILIINEIINITLSSFITEAVVRQNIELPSLLAGTPRWAIDTLIGILITSPIVLLLCEITPKAIAARLNRYIAIVTVGPLNVLYDFFKPIRLVVDAVISLFSGRPKQDLSGHDDSKTILKESDFLIMIEEGHKEGAIGQTELDLIKNVFELDDTPVSDVTTPLTQVLSLPATTTLDGALKAFKSQRYSRIPILHSNQKEVVGILYSKDLLRGKMQPQPNTQTVADLMRKPFFVRSNLQLNSLFRKFKEQKIHMAVVKDPAGEVMGVVTMSDILDAVFEDLFSDERFPSENKKSENDYKNISRDSSHSGSS
jgi:CBS domain containing-hemolysin-like protein